MCVMWMWMNPNLQEQKQLHRPEEKIVSLLLAVAEPLHGERHQTVHLAGQHCRLVVEPSRQVRHEHAGGFRS